MSEWRVRRIKRFFGWVVEEFDRDGLYVKRVVVCGYDEALARRIAKLLELEAIAARLPKTKDGVSICIDDTVWRCVGSKLYQYAIVGIGKDRLSAIVTDEMGCSVGCVLKPEDYYSTREAAEAARKETGS